MTTYNKNVLIFALGALVILGAAAGYFFGHKDRFGGTTKEQISSFDQCVAAGNAVMESYPRQCRANGLTFVETVVNPPGGTVCTMEAKLCPDGSYVGRSGPKCEFTPCPGPSAETDAAYGKPVTLKVNESATWGGGLEVTLKAINDSRCGKGVVCIWAGELAATFQASAGGKTEELHLGTTTKPAASALGHDFRLDGITETSATIVVTK